ncbi:hypothetical protein ACROSR_20290 [Roseovarius tibetensis]
MEKRCPDDLRAVLPGAAGSAVDDDLAHGSRKAAGTPAALYVSAIRMFFEGCQIDNSVGALTSWARRFGRQVIA